MQDDAREAPFDWSPVFDDPDPDADTTPRRRGLVLALATIPWLLVAALLALPGRVGGVAAEPPAQATQEHPAADPADGGDGTVPAEVADPDAAGHPVPGTTSEAGSPRVSGLEAHAGVGPTADELVLTEARGRWRVEPGVEEAAALAVVVARAWLTDLDEPHLVEGVRAVRPDGYAEHLVVEAVERPSADAAVVTLVVVLLDGRADLAPQVRRVAVPVRFASGGPRPAGSPWWLPGPHLDPLPPPRTPVEDPDVALAVVDALVRAGLEVHDLRGVWTTDGWPVVADVAAGTPEGETVDGEVWLRPHLDGLVLAGTTLTPRAAAGQETGDDPEVAP